MGIYLYFLSDKQRQLLREAVYVLLNVYKEYHSGHPEAEALQLLLKKLDRSNG